MDNRKLTNEGKMSLTFKEKELLLMTGFKLEESPHIPRACKDIIVKLCHAYEEELQDKHNRDSLAENNKITKKSLLESMDDMDLETAKKRIVDIGASVARIMQSGFVLFNAFEAYSKPVQIFEQDNLIIDQVEVNKIGASQNGFNESVRNHLEVLEEIFDIGKEKQ